MRRIRALLVALLSVSVSHVLVGQGVAPKPIGPNSLSGVVLDDVGQPLPNAAIFLSTLRRRTLSDENGAFRFDSVRAGEYSVTARAPGFVHTPQSVRVRADGGSGYVRMVRVAHPMLTLISKAERGIFRGTVADTAYAPLRDVLIRALNAKIETRTDSTGAFTLSLAPGSYAVEVLQPGYARKVLGVTIDSDSGRKVAIWLELPTASRDVSDARVMLDAIAAAQRRVVQRGKVYTRDDLDRLGIADLQQLADMTATRRTSQACGVVLGATGELVPGWQLTVDDIEYAEAFRGGVNSAAASSERTRATGIDLPTATRSCQTVTLAGGKTTTKCTQRYIPPPPAGTARADARSVATCAAWVEAWLRN